MSLAAILASLGTADPARAGEPRGSADDASLVTRAEGRMPVDARGLALGVLAVLAVVFALSWAQAFVVPLLLGIVIAYTLNPLVAWLEAIRIPRLVGTVVVMASVIGALVLGGYSLRDEMQTIVEQLPAAATKFATGLARLRGGQIGRYAENAKRRDRGGKGDDSGGQWLRCAAPVCHACHRGPAHVQAG